MKNDKYEIKQGKYLAFKCAGQERCIRCYKLGNNYSEEMIKSRIENKSKFIFNSQTVSRRPLPINVLVKLKDGRVFILR